jgi:hypothetical protein
MSGLAKKIVLSGAITGHKDEAVIYFHEACEKVLERFPLAEVFNPAMIDKLLSYDTAMVICRSRIKNWATTIVYIKNEYYSGSNGVRAEQALAEESGLEEYALEHNVLVRLGGES